MFRHQHQQQQQLDQQVAQGRKVPSGDVGIILSDGEHLQMQLDEFHQRNGHIQPDGYPYSSNFDPDYDDEDYEDDLAVIIQQEFQTGTTTSTAKSITSSTTSTTPSTTTTAPPSTTTTTTMIPPLEFDAGSPSVVHLKQSIVPSVHNWTAGPTTVPPEYLPHHYVVRQEFSVSSITNYVRPSTTSPPKVTTPPPVRTANQIRRDEEEEDVYKLLGQIEADVPRIRTGVSTKTHQQQLHNTGATASVFVPRFKRQAPVQGLVQF